MVENDGHVQDRFTPMCCVGVVVALVHVCASGFIHSTSCWYMLEIVLHTACSAYYAVCSTRTYSTNKTRQ